MDKVFDGLRMEGFMIELIDEKDFPCNDPDFMAELKMTRDMHIYLSIRPPLLDEMKIASFEAEITWNAHDGSVVKSMCIQNPPSIVTASNDGFMCAWNTQGLLLGEMRLPNADETKVYQRKQRHFPIKEVDWNFPQERHEVSDEHMETAKGLLATQERRMSRARGSTIVHRGGASGGASPGAPQMRAKAPSALWSSIRADVVEHKAVRLKQSTLSAFGANFTVKHGVIKTPTRAKRRGAVNQDGGMGLGGQEYFHRTSMLKQIKTEGNAMPKKEPSRMSQMSAPGSAPAGSPGGFTLNDFSDMFENDPFDKIVNTGKVPDVPDAFTYRSIHVGAVEGVYDFEQCKELAKVGMFKERKDAYSRAYPVVVPPHLDKLKEVRAAPFLDEMEDLGRSSGIRPSTTGGISTAEKMKRRQNWRGYKNLVNEFERSTKNVRRPPNCPAGSQSSGSRKGRDYVAPGSAPSMPSLGRVQTSVNLNTDLADKLEDDMSESEDDEEEDAIRSRSGSVASSASNSPMRSPTMRDGMGGGMKSLFALTQDEEKEEKRKPRGTRGTRGKGGEGKDMEVHLHMIRRNSLRGNRDLGIKSIAMDHVLDKMHDAEDEEDHTLMTGTHADVVHRQEVAKRSYLENKKKKGGGTVITTEGELTRKFSVLMNQKAVLDDFQAKDALKRSGLVEKKSSSDMRRSSSVGNMKASPAKPKMPSKWSELRQGAFGPNYTVDEIKHFYSCFSFVDQDMSGEIDVDEWQQFLNGMDQQMSPTDARRLFMHIDANHNGVIDMSEISKVVFNRATPEQLKVMINVMTNQTQMQKRLNQSKREFTRNDLRELFKLYDENDEKRLSVAKLKSAFTILSVPGDVVEGLFEERGIDVVTGDIDADEFTDIFHDYLRQLMSKH